LSKTENKNEVLKDEKAKWEVAEVEREIATQDIRSLRKFSSLVPIGVKNV
jgi:hypothetical protein